MLSQHGNEKGFLSRLSKMVKKVGGNDSVSELIDKSATTVSRYRNGGEIPFDCVLKLAQATNVDMNWVATGEGTGIPEKGETPPFPELAARIRHCLDAHTLEELAKQSGVPLDRLKRYQAGLCDITGQDVAKIAPVADVQAKWLATGEGSVIAIPETDYVITHEIVKECSLALHTWLKKRKETLNPEATASVTALLCSIRQEQDKIDPKFIDMLMDARGRP